LHMGFRPSGS